MLMLTFYRKDTLGGYFNFNYKYFYNLEFYCGKIFWIVNIIHIK